MLGILLIYWLGKYFYKLAEVYDKSKWGFAVLGVVTYYAITFVFAITFVIVAEIVSPGYIDTVNERVLDLISLPFGLLASYLLYKYLKKTWKKNQLIGKSKIDDIGVS
jgi:hypothetical protein